MACHIDAAGAGNAPARATALLSAAAPGPAVVTVGAARAVATPVGTADHIAGQAAGGCHGAVVRRQLANCTETTREAAGVTALPAPVRAAGVYQGDLVIALIAPARSAGSLDQKPEEQGLVDNVRALFKEDLKTNFINSLL